MSNIFELEYPTLETLDPLEFIECKKCRKKLPYPVKRLCKACAHNQAYIELLEQENSYLEEQYIKYKVRYKRFKEENEKLKVQLESRPSFWTFLRRK